MDELKDLKSKLNIKDEDLLKEIYSQKYNKT
jgi:hypothetical protein